MSGTKNEIVVYQPNETVRLEVRLENDTVWLNRHQMAQLFGRDVKTIGKHIANALTEELSSDDSRTALLNPTVAATEATETIQLSQNLRQLLRMGRFIKWSTTILM